MPPEDDFSLSKEHQGLNGNSHRALNSPESKSGGGGYSPKQEWNSNGGAVLSPIQSKPQAEKNNENKYNRRGLEGINKTPFFTPQNQTQDRAGSSHQIFNFS